jgi:hypothetical protein
MENKSYMDAFLYTKLKETLHVEHAKKRGNFYL